MNTENKIPKIIHYCWFGPNEKSKLVKDCIKSWKKYLPDYEIREWNDNDLIKCDNQYVKEAYKHKKWAFISDWFRLYALYTYGGIYFDSDNEVFKPFDEFLTLDFFSGYENICDIVSPFTAVVGAKKHNHIIKDLLDEYENLHFENTDGSANLYTNTERVTNYFKEKYKVTAPYNPLKKIYLEENSIIFPDNIFCRYDKKTSYAVHHFTGSWKPKEKYCLKKRIIETIFSIKNSTNKNHKILTILGLKLKFRYTKLKPSYAIRDVINLYKFKNILIKPNTVLIVEPNPYHAEILPGFVKYFQDLNYNVDILVRHENIEDSPFKGLENFNIFGFSANMLKKVLKLDKIKNYKYLFLSSSAYWEKNVYWDSFLNFLGYTPKTQKGILLVEHNIKSCLNKYNEENYLKESRLFTLSGFHNSPMLNPHYFIKNNTHQKNRKTQFIIVGHWAKSKELLYETLTKLYTNGYKDFEILIVGAKYKLPKIYQQNVKMLGRIKFTRLYNILKNTDFILAMLDYSDKSHQRYLEDATSGSRQLSLGFNKPILINEAFAKVYNFDDTNAIAYKENDLYEAMKQAIEMTQEDYSKKQMFLKNLANEIYNKSLENLRKVVEKK